MRPIDEDECLWHRDAVVPGRGPEGKLSLDARPAECRNRALDARRQRRIGGVGVDALRSRVDAVIEPGARPVALEAMEPPGMGHLDRAQTVHRHRQQQVRIGVAVPPRSGTNEIGVLERHDRPDQRRQREPDGHEPGAEPAGVHRCLHHTAVPTTASRAGTRITERKNVPFIWRLVRLIRGRS